LVTLTVSDGLLSASTSFLIRVTSPPDISGISDQTINEDASLGPIAFSVTDLDTPGTNLVISVLSSNQVLLPNTNIVVTGAGNSRSLTGLPAANRFGTSLLTVTVSDGISSSSTTFLLTVVSVNDPPVISTIVDQNTTQNQPAGPIPFVISDLETPADILRVRGHSSNPSLVPDANITFAGSGNNRTFTINPANNHSGNSTIQIETEDENGATAQTTFLFTVVPVPPTLTIAHLGSTQVQIGFQTAAGATYLLEFKEHLTDPAWTTLANLGGNGTSQNYIDNTAASSTRFYRVRAQ
jgi:hypothetical protein